MEASWAVLGDPKRLWRHLGPSWRRLGSVLEESWKPLGLSWERLGGVLGASWEDKVANMAPTWPPKRSQDGEQIDQHFDHFLDASLDRFFMDF